MSTLILPPATIGILGSGQLGRMLAVAARYMGYRVHVYSPRPEPTPAGRLADKAYTAPYDDLEAVRRFAQGVDVVTYEFENVPAATAATCAEFVPLRPGAQALHVAQNRRREKQFFVDQGLPVAPYAPVHSLDDLEAALAEIGTPAMLKTATSGYDGKGQVLIGNGQWSIVNGQPAIANKSQSPISDLRARAKSAWEAVGQRPCILEGFVEFEREVSMVGARSVDGTFAHYGLIHNDHVNQILDVSQAPADVPPGIVAEAARMTRAVLEGLEVVGVLCVEFFLTPGGELLLNEIAPRPHNSGHLTIDACLTGQFEQQLRAVCGLPLGDTAYLRAAAMANLLGDLWFQRRGAEAQRGEDKANVEMEQVEPDWTAVLSKPGLKFHLYDKVPPRPGRKMGHITALADTAAEAAKIVREARDRLVRD